MKRLLILLFVVLATPVWAQNRPIVGSTVRSTDTTANSVLVGCAVGSTTCTGGVKAGVVDGPDATAGLTLSASHATGIIYFSTAGAATARWTITAAGDLLPATNMGIGADASRVRDITLACGGAVVNVGGSAAISCTPIPSALTFGNTTQTTTINGASTTVKGATGIIFADNGTQPACTVDIRGAVWFEASGAGAKDKFEICAKDAGDAYAWRVLY